MKTKRHHSPHGGDFFLQILFLPDGLLTLCPNPHSRAATLSGCHTAGVTPLAAPPAPSATSLE